MTRSPSFSRSSSSTTTMNLPARRSATASSIFENGPTGVSAIEPHFLTGVQPRRSGPKGPAKQGGPVDDHGCQLSETLRRMNESRSLGCARDDMSLGQPDWTVVGDPAIEAPCK